MADKDQALTASNIKYLLVLEELSRDTGGVRCVDIADTLGVTKPSVHMMMKTLKNMELVCKDKYGMVFFTKQGRCLAKQYSKYFKTIDTYFHPIFPKGTDIKAVACVLLAGLSDKSIQRMCSMMQYEMIEKDKISCNCKQKNF
ncbi:MAG: helix-turn-helix domain-containing protein [Oscillospiraceae bacterium]|jgi:Mn-dependent DtxR family transcriptional regulator|nr:helix-turn-helix domain-containing protein [Oscillospiraceae bacterium]